MFRKVISGLLTVVVLSSMAIPAFATETRIQILEDTNEIVIVKEVTEDMVILSTNNKEQNTLTIEKYDLTSNDLISQEIILTDEPTTFQEEIMMSSIPAVESYEYQRTFTNREYGIFTFDDGSVKWELKSEDSIKPVWQSSLNIYNLNKFRNYVEDVNDAEWAVIAACGVSTATIAFSAFLTGGLGAAIAAAGTSVIIVDAFESLDTAIYYADYYFNKF